MTEIGEAVAANLIAIDHDPDDCPFCQQTPVVVRDNVFIANYDEDAARARDPEQWVRFTREPATLAGRLDHPGTRGLRRVDARFVPGEDLPVAVVPHHLIPGDDALKRSTLVTSGDYLRGDGSAAGNIGYDVNRAANGVWAPGHQAYRPWGVNGAAFTVREGVPAQAYVEAAIEVWQAQFHEAHESYSEIVRDALDHMQASLKQQERAVCPHAAGRSPDSGALTVLVQRLDALASRLRRLVRFPTTGWKAEVFLSRASQLYMSEHQLGGD